MLAKSMEVAVKTIMENHLYQFDGKVFGPTDVGPIGLEVTGVLARLVMLWWDKKYLHILQGLDLKLDFYKRYLDDGNMACKALKPGVRFVEGRLSIPPGAEAEDENLPADLRTGRLLRTIANSIIPMIRMVEDVPSNHNSRKLPILDLEVWGQDDQILHQFLKKSMAIKL